MSDNQKSTEIDEDGEYDSFDCQCLMSSYTSSLQKAYLCSTCTRDESDALSQCHRNSSLTKMVCCRFTWCILIRLDVSQQLGNADEVSLLQIFKPRERSVEILRQVKDLLRHLNDVLLFTFRHLN